MIRLEVEEYCHGCPEFTASVDKEQYYGDGKVVEADCRVSCENERLCRNIRDYMQHVAAGGSNSYADL